jgi:hypothetical protein
MSYTITEQALPLDMPGTLPVFEEVTATDHTHVLRWNNTEARARLDEMTDTERKAWYDSIMRDRMAALDVALDGNGHTSTLEAALNVARWALSIARNIPEVWEDDHRAALLSAVSAALTMAHHPHPGDAVTLTWGTDADA